MDTSFNTSNSLINPMNVYPTKAIKGLEKYKLPNKNVLFETETYMRQRKNRFEDGSIIPLGIPLSQPYKSNGQATKYIHYAGSLNALEPKKEKGKL